jgi:propanol-preferring alcohol dehydrogenase
VVVGVGDDPIEVDASALVFGSRSIVGSLTGSSIENEASLQFSATHGVAPMTEVLPFEEAPAAYKRMMSGHARFRVVLDMRTQ